MKKIRVAFIAHPLNLNDLAVISNWPKSLVKAINKEWLKRHLEVKKPFVFSHVNSLESKSGTLVDLISIACPLLPEQMVVLNEKVVVKKIIDCVLLAKKKGANIVVLGGFTSVIGNEGAEVAKNVDIALTSGNTYTACLAIEGVIKATEIVGVDLKRARCAIIGATGDIGGACARFFCDKVGSMAIAARNEKKLDIFADKLSKMGGKIQIYKKTRDAIFEADVIISATSAITTIINPAELKKGAIVCDVALPANIAREVSRQRRDVLVFEGGLCSVPFYNKIKNKKWDKLLPTNAVYGCLAEGLILGFENRFENFSLGRGLIDLKKMNEMNAMAKRQGFGLSKFFCGDKFYEDKDIDYLRKMTKY